MLPCHLCFTERCVPRTKNEDFRVPCHFDQIPYLREIYLISASVFQTETKNGPLPETGRMLSNSTESLKSVAQRCWCCTRPVAPTELQW